MCRNRWLECRYGNKSWATGIGNIKEYYDNFDVDEEAYLWLDETGHGKNGAPYRMKDVVEDMEEAEKMIDRLLDAIMELEQSL